MVICVYNIKINYMTYIASFKVFPGESALFISLDILCTDTILDPYGGSINSDLINAMG